MDVKQERGAAETATAGPENGSNQGAAPGEVAIENFAEDLYRAMPVSNPEEEEEEEKRDEAAMASAIKSVARLAPQDDLEGIMATQLLAAHGAVINCYQEAMIPHVGLAWRREHLSQAARLTRATVTTIAALQRYRINAAKAVGQATHAASLGPERAPESAKRPHAQETALVAQAESLKQPHVQEQAPPLAPDLPDGAPNVASVAGGDIGPGSYEGRADCEQAESAKRPHAQRAAASPHAQPVAQEPAPPLEPDVADAAPTASPIAGRDNGTGSHEDRAGSERAEAAKRPHAKGAGAAPRTNSAKQAHAQAPAAASSAIAPSAGSVPAKVTSVQRWPHLSDQAYAAADPAQRQAILGLRRIARSNLEPGEAARLCDEDKRTIGLLLSRVPAATSAPVVPSAGAGPPDCESPYACLSPEAYAAALPHKQKEILNERKRILGLLSQEDRARLYDDDKRALGLI